MRQLLLLCFTLVIFILHLVHASLLTQNFEPYWCTASENSHTTSTSSSNSFPNFSSPSQHPLRVAIISTFLPQKCGLASFTNELRNNMLQYYSSQFETIDVFAMYPTSEGSFSYDSSIVKQTISKDKLEEYIFAADTILQQHYDVLLIEHEYGIFGGTLGDYIIKLMKRIKKKDSSIRIFTTLHTVLPTEKMEMQMALTTKQLIEWSDKIITLSESGCSLLSHLVEHVNQCQVLHYGIEKYNLQPTSTFKQFGWDSSKFLVMTFGLISRTKGIEYMLEAMKQLVPNYPQLVYVIIGQTHPQVIAEYLPNLKLKAKQYGLERNVQFLSQYYATAELNELLLHAQVYVNAYPGKEQISSGSLTQALALGIPMISTDYNYAVDLLAKDGLGILVPVKNSSALAEALELLVQNEKLRRELQCRTLLKRRELLWETIIQHYLQLFTTESVKKSHENWNQRESWLSITKSLLMDSSLVWDSIKSTQQDSFSSLQSIYLSQQNIWIGNSLFEFLIQIGVPHMRISNGIATMQISLGNSFVHFYYQSISYSIRLHRQSLLDFHMDQSSDEKTIISWKEKVSFAETFIFVKEYFSIEMESMELIHTFLIEIPSELEGQIENVKLEMSTGESMANALQLDTISILTTASVLPVKQIPTIEFRIPITESFALYNSQNQFSQQTTTNQQGQLKISLVNSKIEWSRVEYEVAQVMKSEERSKEITHSIRLSFTIPSVKKEMNSVVPYLPGLFVSAYGSNRHRLISKEWMEWIVQTNHHTLDSIVGIITMIQQYETNPESNLEYIIKAYEKFKREIKDCICHLESHKEKVYILSRKMELLEVPLTKSKECNRMERLGSIFVELKLNQVMKLTHSKQVVEWLLDIAPNSLSHSIEQYFYLLNLLQLQKQDQGVYSFAIQQKIDQLQWVVEEDLQLEFVNSPQMEETLWKLLLYSLVDVFLY